MAEATAFAADRKFVLVISFIGLPDGTGHPLMSVRMTKSPIALH